MAQLVECPTSAQVMISWLVSSSPTSGSLLSAQSLPLFLPLPRVRVCARALSKINENIFKKGKTTTNTRSPGERLLCPPSSLKWSLSQFMEALTGALLLSQCQVLD